MTAGARTSVDNLLMLSMLGVEKVRDAALEAAALRGRERDQQETQQI